MIATVIAVVLLAVLLGAAIWAFFGAVAPPARDIPSRRVEWPDDL